MERPSWLTFPVMFKLPDCPAKCDNAHAHVHMQSFVYLVMIHVQLPCYLVEIVQHLFNIFSLASSMAMSVGWSFNPQFGPDCNISRTIEWITKKYFIDFHGSQRINPIDFCDPLTFTEMLP